MPLNADQIEAWHAALQVLRGYSQQTGRSGDWTYRGVAQAANSNAVIHVAAFLKDGDPEHLTTAGQELRLWGRKETRIADILTQLQAQLNNDMTPEDLMQSTWDGEIDEAEVRSVLKRFRETGRVPDNWLDASFDWRWTSFMRALKPQPSIAEFSNAPSAITPARATLREAAG